MTLFLCYFETGPALLLLKPAIVGQDYLPETKLMQKERPQRNDITLCRTHPTKENAEILTAESLRYRRLVLIGSGCTAQPALIGYKCLHGTLRTEESYVKNCAGFFLF